MSSVRWCVLYCEVALVNNTTNHPCINQSYSGITQILHKDTEISEVNLSTSEIFVKTPMYRNHNMIAITFPKRNQTIVFTAQKGTYPPAMFKGVVTCGNSQVITTC